MQVNYSASNACLDGLARHRVAMGKPCTAIHWGAWGEVGMAATMDDVMRNRVMMGPMPYFTVAQGLQGLEGGLRTGLPEFSVFIVNTPVMYGMMMPDQHVTARYARNSSNEWLPMPVPSAFDREFAYDIYRMYRYIFSPYENNESVLWKKFIQPDPPRKMLADEPEEQVIEVRNRALHEKDSNGDTSNAHPRAEELHIVSSVPQEISIFWLPGGENDPSEGRFSGMLTAASRESPGIFSITTYRGHAFRFQVEGLRSRPVKHSGDKYDLVLLSKKGENDLDVEHLNSTALQQLVGEMHQECHTKVFQVCCHQYGASQRGIPSSFTDKYLEAFSPTSSRLTPSVISKGDGNAEPLKLEGDQEENGFSYGVAPPDEFIVLNHSPGKLDVYWVPFPSLGFDGPPPAAQRSHMAEMAAGEILSLRAEPGQAFFAWSSADPRPASPLFKYPGELAIAVLRQEEATKDLQADIVDQDELKVAMSDIASKCGDQSKVGLASAFRKCFEAHAVFPGSAVPMPPVVSFFWAAGARKWWLCSNLAFFNVEVLTAWDGSACWMSITVEVSLISGKTAAVDAEGHWTVEDLSLRAQCALGVGKGRLLNSSGDILEATATVNSACVQHGDVLTFHVGQVRLSMSKDYALGLSGAALLGDGSVASWGWGKPACAIDISAVQDQLQNVAHVQASNYAYAAIRADGSVVTWGDIACGGDVSVVQDQLQNVRHIQASSRAFAAIQADGSVVAWGHADYGGDTQGLSDIQDRLQNVECVQSSSAAFAAIRADGSVVTWGSAGYGGDSTAVQEQLRDVKDIQASSAAFAAIRADGSVVTWGDSHLGGDSSKVQDRLQNVKHIQVSLGAFAAIRADGSVVTWGRPSYGSSSTAVEDLLQNVLCLQASSRAFAAILDDGSVVTWGLAAFGGSCSHLHDQLQNVRQIQSSCRAFAAIRSDGSVVTWGDADCGGDSTPVQD
eukprot:s4846_g2.t2